MRPNVQNTATQTFKQFLVQQNVGDAANVTSDAPFRYVAIDPFDDE